ncbi:hypothetical protein SHKM778_06150 [Streptomyces sp. KM77-8]|uniref:Uncharacterized protein n=1 Tax=Streptomyces haneummycinicus TaxID=3074435 RepID=A0AAT9HA20_9ACTN
MSRLFQEQLPRVETSSEDPSLPFFASGTRSSRIFSDSTAHGSGSVLYAAASTVGDGLADFEAEAAVSLPSPEPESESEEQPAATRGRRPRRQGRG